MKVDVQMKRALQEGDVVELKDRVGQVKVRITSVSNGGVHYTALPNVSADGALSLIGGYARLDTFDYSEVTNVSI